MSSNVQPLMAGWVELRPEEGLEINSTWVLSGAKKVYEIDGDEDLDEDQEDGRWREKKKTKECQHLINMQRKKAEDEVREVVKRCNQGQSLLKTNIRAAHW